MQQNFGAEDKILPDPCNDVPPTVPCDGLPPTGHRLGDANDDGLVSGSDLIGVQQNFDYGAPQRKNGRLAASRESGLGIRPRHDVLGAPVLERS